MSAGVRLARHTPVAVCHGLLAIEPLLADADEELLAVVRRSAAQPATRVLGIVDEAGRLIGVAPVSRLAEAVVVRVVPESLMSVSDVEDAARFGQSVGARVVSDVMLPPITVSPSDTVADAFRLMHQHQLLGLYVVGPDGRPVGYLDLLELAIGYVDALEQADPGPASGVTDAPPPKTHR